ncbi:hypothetical protein [Microcoleus sp. OTE_8_concoct_300]|uniref:hypothetical protein n=1 Tax=Microcoleus sp. OTE_8_concoct_300 TaxID=2964710 RepID=UPI00403F37D5
MSGLQIFYSVGRRIFSDGSDGQKLESRHLHSASEAKVCHDRDFWVKVDRTMRLEFS